MNTEKNRYLCDVRRRLALPRARRREVLRDLEELFDAAAARGETPDAVIRRLGPADAYADAVTEQLADPTRRRVLPALLLAVGAALLALYAAIRADLPPADAIGGAQGSTQIQVTGGVDLLWLLPALGAAAVIAAALLWLRRRRTP